MLKNNVFNPNSSSSKKPINAGASFKLQDYCLKEQWNALYAITIIYANILMDKTGIKGKQFKAMAKVSQEIRYKALNSSAGAFDNLQGGALFVQEQQESLWKEGFEMFKQTFPKSTEDGTIDYSEFMYMMGTYNINNLDYCIFLTQSHLNHICDSNTVVETSTSSRLEGLKVYAARDNRGGYELTTSYVNPAHNFQQRQRELRVNWGFICGCQKCKDDVKIQQRRKSSTGAHMKESKAEIREMLSNTKDEIGEEGIELSPPLDFNGERRKSVRFDEKVIAVKE